MVWPPNGRSRKASGVSPRARPSRDTDAPEGVERTRRRPRTGSGTDAGRTCAAGGATVVFGAGAGTAGGSASGGVSGTTCSVSALGVEVPLVSVGVGEFVDSARSAGVGVDGDDTEDGVWSLVASHPMPNPTTAAAAISPANTRTESTLLTDARVVW
jgi:hypothetical protein